MSVDSGPQPAAEWLDKREMRAWRAFVETVADLQTAFDDDLRSHGMTFGDYQVLVYLNEAADSQMRMCDLANLLQLTPSGLTRRLDGLVRLGWVERNNSKLDRRVMLAQITETGREQLTTAAPFHVASVRSHFLTHVDPDDLDALARSFERIRAHLDEVVGKHPYPVAAD